MGGERAVWGLGYSNFHFEKGWMARGSWSWGGPLKIESSFGWFDSWVWEYLPQACPSSFPRLRSKSRDILRFAEDAVLALSLEETLCHFRGLLRLMSILNMLMVYSIAFALASFLVDWVDRPETPFLTGIRHQPNSHCMFSTP